MPKTRNVTTEDYDPRSRFGLYRLCKCPTCKGSGKGLPRRTKRTGPLDYRCSDCRGEGRILQEVSSAESPEAVGVALVTNGGEGEWEGCAFGLLDRAGAKNEKWLVLPWLPSARNVTDAARTLARSKKATRSD